MEISSGDSLPKGLVDELPDLDLQGRVLFLRCMRLKKKHPFFVGGKSKAKSIQKLHITWFFLLMIQLIFYLCKK